jgi:tetratricopeptide (TPR) repeat protein
MMYFISKISVLTVFLNLLFLPNPISARAEQENPLTKAIQLFDKKNFSEAEIAFKKLIDERPDDFMINYFYGASRTENGHYSDTDLGYLEKASKEVYPIDIDYYFGVQYHAKNRFNTAIIYYNNFKKVAAVEDQNRVELAEKIKLCEQEINPFVLETAMVVADSSLVVTENGAEQHEEVNVAAVSAITTSVVVAGSIDSIPENEAVSATDEMPVTTVVSDSTIAENNEIVTEIAEKQPVATVQLPAEPMINFNINSEITYLFESNFKTNEGAIYFKEGNSKQAEMDKIGVRTEILREEYSKSKNRVEKDSLGRLIVELENESYQMKGVVKQLLMQAKTAENNYWQSVPPQEKEKFINELETISVAINKENTKEKETAITGILVAPLLVEDAPVEKPVNEVKNTGVNYKIQLGAYSKGIPNNMKPTFKKISMLRKVENYIDDKGVVVYTTGNLTRYDDALVMLNQVKQEGVKDAIIAAYQNGKRITLEQAKETEKQK